MKVSLRSKIRLGPLLLSLVLLAGVAVWAQPMPDAGNLRAFIELARSDLKTQKAVILAGNLPLTEEEGSEFWPLQGNYQHELTKPGDFKLALVEQYAANFQSMTDAAARDLATKSFDLEEKKTDLKRRYFTNFEKVIPAKKAARFFQIDNQLNLALDRQVAGSLPLIK